MPIYSKAFCIYGLLKKECLIYILNTAYRHNMTRGDKGQCCYVSYNCKIMFGSDQFSKKTFCMPLSGYLLVCNVF